MININIHETDTLLYGVEIANPEPKIFVLKRGEVFHVERGPEGEWSQYYYTCSPREGVTLYQLATTSGREQWHKWLLAIMPDGQRHYVYNEYGIGRHGNEERSTMISFEGLPGSVQEAVREAHL
jgi:hypothetical protein